MRSPDSLTQIEQFLLLSLLRLGTNAYGMTIRREISERAGKDISIGAVYTNLERLEHRGYVKSRQGEATKERGGRAKKYFDITGSGQKALNEAHQAMENMWDGIALPVGV